MSNSPSRVLEPDLIFTGGKVVYRSDKERERELVRLVAVGAVMVAEFSGRHF